MAVSRRSRSGKSFGLRTFRCSTEKIISGLDGISVEITPDRLNSYGNHQTSNHGLGVYIGMTETGKRKSESAGYFAGQSLDLHNALRGKKSAVCRTWEGPPGHPVVRRRTVSSTSRRLDGAPPGAERSARFPCRKLPRERSWHEPPYNKGLCIALMYQRESAPRCMKARG